MSIVERKRRITWVLAGLLIFAGLGAVMHTLDHDGQPADAVCGFCATATHGKAPPLAILVEWQAVSSAVWPSADPASSHSAHTALLPPARAPPPEVSA